MPKARADIVSLAGSPSLWREAHEKIATLTPREREVLVGIAAGLTNREIAEAMGISVRTIDIHRGNMKKKLGEGTGGGVARLAVYAAFADAILAPRELA